MLDDSSFLVGLSFVVFCLCVWFWKGKDLSQTMREYVEFRLSPLRQAEARYAALESGWIQARKKNDQLLNDVEDIKTLYAQKKTDILLAMQKKEEAWYKSKQIEFEKSQRIAKRLAEQEELEKILQEFMKQEEG